jgi:hypothetical protein
MMFFGVGAVLMLLALLSFITVYSVISHRHVPAQSTRLRVLQNPTRVRHHQRDQSERVCTDSPCFTCKNISVLASSLANATTLGNGFYKRALLVQHGSSLLVVKTPHEQAASYLAARWALKNNGSVLSARQVRQKLASKFADEQRQMMRWSTAQTAGMVPRVFGGCYDDANDGALSIATIVEPLRAMADVTFDGKVTLSQRLMIAASVLRLVSMWDSITPFNHSRAETDAISAVKDYRVVSANALIYGDFDPKQVRLRAS